MSLVERTVTVVNDLGLHARPSAALVEVAGQFKCAVNISKEGGDPVNGKSILGIMTLAVEHGSALTIHCEGEDAEDAAEALAALVGRGFDE